MNPVNVADGDARRIRLSQAKHWRLSASDVGLHTAVAICVVAGTMLFYTFCYPLHQDVAGNLLSGRLAVTLGSAYSDYSIYFPPVEKVWYSLASHLSDLTGLRLDLTIVAMSGAMVLFGTGLAYHIRRIAVGASPWFLVVSVAVLVIVPILYKNMFGMREHIIVAGLWPYLVLRASDPDGTRIGWRLRMLVGLWLGVTLLFKTLYSIVVALVELADALVQRRPLLLFRIENLLSGMIVFLYLLLWLGVDPDQRAGIGAMLSAIDANLSPPFWNRFHAAENLVLAIILLIASRIFRVPIRPVALAFALVLGTIIAAWSQQRWYTHHVFPITMAYVAWWWMATRQFRLWGHAVLAVYLTFAVGTEYFATQRYHANLDELDKALAEAGLSVAGKRVGILNMHPSPYNEYLASHGALRWTPLMNIAYLAPELEAFDSKENIGKATPPVKLDDPGRQMLHDQWLRLWEDMPPDVLIFDNHDNWPLRHLEVNWIQVYSNDPRFAAILANYRPVLEYDGNRIAFTYYVRAH